SGSSSRTRASLPSENSAVRTKSNCKWPSETPEARMGRERFIFNEACVDRARTCLLKDYVLEGRKSSFHIAHDCVKAAVAIPAIVKIAEDRPGVLTSLPETYVWTRFGALCL